MTILWWIIGAIAFVEISMIALRELYMSLPELRPEAPMDASGLPMLIGKSRKQLEKFAAAASTMATQFGLKAPRILIRNYLIDFAGIRYSLLTGGSDLVINSLILYFTVEMWSATIAHELAHVKRRFHLFPLLQQVCPIPFLFLRSIREEIAVDRLAARYVGSATMIALFDTLKGKADTPKGLKIQKDFLLRITALSAPIR